MTTIPETRFATVGDDRVAYQVLGDGSLDVVLSTGPWGHLDLEWEDPAAAPSRFGFEERGMHTLKGVPGEWLLYALRP